MATGGESSKQPIPPSMAVPMTVSSVSTLFKPSPFLERLCKWLSTVVGTDQLIMLIQYSLDIITHHMDVHSLSRAVSALKRGRAISFRPVPTSPSPLSTRLHTLSGKLSDVRILLRLLGIIPCYQWLLSTHISPPSDPTIATIVKLQTYANMLYFPLENAAYLASHSILPLSKRTEADLWLWSCRFWGAHVALEFCRLYRERAIKSKGKAVDKPELKTLDRRWWAELVMNLAYAPLTVHWSLEKGLGFRDVEIGYLGVIAAVASIYMGWPA